MIPDHLRIQPDQERLSPEQEAEARRFAGERIEAQLATSPVDEPEAERLLRQAYLVAGLSPPRRIRWVDGPLPLVAVLAAERFELSDRSPLEMRLWDGVEDIRECTLGKSLQTNYQWVSVYAYVWDCVGEQIKASVWASLRASGVERLEVDIWLSLTRAYGSAAWLAHSRFFDTYLAPNAEHALAHFNERVSGYWLGNQEALLVRRPCVLARDAMGLLHSERGKCIEYPDGWGFYAWHGVLVPEQVILSPERLTRADFLNEKNVEVRRIMQERMGERFVPQLGGQVIESGPRGTLYEVCLPADDPEGVARYVQVQDASTERRYFLRVPPTIQTVAEAVAWTFQVAADDYCPAQET